MTKPKEEYRKPEIYRVKLEPEQAVLACCQIGNQRRKYINSDCGTLTDCIGLGGPSSATSS